MAYLLTPSAWGQGYASEAVAAMLQHLFGSLGARQAMAMVERDNRHSIALLARLGFGLATAEQRQGHELSPTEQLWLRGAAPRLG